MDNLILYISCTALGGAGAWFIYRIGGKIGLLDIANERSSHEGFVPKGGGIGVLAAFFVCSIILSVPKSFWIPTVLLSLFSLWGDHSEIRPRTRLLLQFAAGVVLLIGVSLEKGGGLLGYALIPPLAIFVVGTANFYNFMDGINGIAGFTGVVGFGLLSLFTHLQGENNFLMVLSISLSLSCLGFLPFNVPKAKVFMGDVGSILLGFVFASMVVILADYLSDVIILVSFLFPFYADEVVTLVERLKDKEKLTNPHRRHLYQVLANECELAHWKISLGYSLFQLTVGICVWVAASYHFIYSILSLMAFSCIFVIANSKVKKSYPGTPLSNG